MDLPQYSYSKAVFGTFSLSFAAVTTIMGDTWTTLKCDITKSSEIKQLKYEKKYLKNKHGHDMIQTRIVG